MDNRIMDKSYIGWIWDFKGIKWILRWLIIRNFESSLNQHKKWGQIDTPIWPHSLSLLSTFLLLSPVNNPWFWQSYFWHKVYFDITRKRDPRLASSRRGWGTRGFTQLERQRPRQGPTWGLSGGEAIPFQTTARCGRVKGGYWARSNRCLIRMHPSIASPLWTIHVIYILHTVWEITAFIWVCISLHYCHSQRQLFIDRFLMNDKS